MSTSQSQYKWFELDSHSIEATSPLGIYAREHATTKQPPQQRVNNPIFGIGYTRHQSEQMFTKNGQQEFPTLVHCVFSALDVHGQPISGGFRKSVLVFLKEEQS